MSLDLRSWIRAARPRTVLLSFSGVLMGGFLALNYEDSNVTAIVFCALTAILLQILSNLANDYGDFKKGTDNAQRKGPQREMQSGTISEKEMLFGIALVGATALLSGAVLIFFVARLTWTELAIFAALGIAAVLAALLYTLGKHPYGYRGLGDLFCFLFFGWAAVFGTFYLATKNLNFSVLLPASAIGFMSNAVLNINNMRDFENDKASGKNSLVVKIGLKRAFAYHLVLIAGAFVMLTVFCIIKHLPIFCYAFWLLAPLFAKDLIQIEKSEPAQLDPMLPKQVVKTFLLVLVFGITILILTLYPFPI